MNRLSVLPILAQVSSPLFEELSLDIAGIDTNSLDDWKDQFDWKSVAKILSQPQFANLKRICVEWALHAGLDYGPSDASCGLAFRIRAVFCDHEAWTCSAEVGTYGINISVDVNFVSTCM